MARKKKARRRSVFLSHSSRDTYWAKYISARLQECGAEVFLDAQKIDAGADFEGEILAALSQADEMVLYATPWALESAYVMFEVGIAATARVPIVTILHGLTSDEFQARHLPNYLKSRSIITIDQLDEFIDQFRRRAQ